MSNLKLIFTIIIVTLTMSYGIGQEYKLEEKSVTSISIIPEKSKSELFTSINKWISINYNSAKNVIQMNDKESGTIIIKGINKVVYENSMKSVFPNNKYIQDYTTTRFNHLIEINIKDNKYRIIYRITDIADDDAGYNYMVFRCISLNGTNERSISEYNEIVAENLKKGFVGKKKREKFKAANKLIFKEINTSLLENIKQTMKSIKQSVMITQEDDW